MALPSTAGVESSVDSDGSFNPKGLSASAPAPVSGKVISLLEPSKGLQADKIKSHDTQETTNDGVREDDSDVIRTADQI